MAENQATSATRSERRRPPLPKVAPWLVIPYGKGMKIKLFITYVNQIKGLVGKFISELSGKSFFQKPSHQGWLVIVCDDEEVDYTPNWIYGDCFLWNPITLETIQLPNILTSGYTYDDYYFQDSVLSSPPKTATTSTNLGNGNESMVFFVLERREDEYEYVFLFCRPGDKQWKTHKYFRDRNIDEDNNISSLHYIKGNLYAMSCSRFSNYKIGIEKTDDNSLSLCVRLFETSDHTPVGGGLYTSRSRIGYVQTYEEFYRLELHTTYQGLEVISVDVARLDFSSMVWKEVNSLGDNVLFYGQNTVASCSAAELGLTRGCLYYTVPDNKCLYKFELEGMSTMILPCLKLPTPWFTSNWIMMPTTFRVAGEGQEITESKLHKREKDSIVEPEGLYTSSGNKNHGIICNCGEVENQRPWNILNEDTINLLASYLHPFDYKEFRSVCKENRSILPIAKKASTSNSILNRTYVSPFLVYSITTDCTLHKFVDPMNNNENYLMKLPLLGGAKIRFQKGGWLLMSEGNHKLFFHNPFTKETIELPDLPTDYDFPNISFSSLPTCSDCVVFGIRVRRRPSSIGVYLIAKGENSWRFHQFDNIYMDHYRPLFNTSTLHEGTLYCVDYSGHLGAFNLEDRSYKVLPKPRAQFNDAYPSFLVECGGDLLLVKLGRNGTLVGVFKLDFSRMEWVGIKSLGKYMLFVSYTSCISRIAPNSGMENKIYFARLSSHGEGILYYSLDTGSYHSLGSHHWSKDFSDSKGFSSWSWIEPNWSRSSVQELEWTATLS